MFHSDAYLTALRDKFPPIPEALRRSGEAAHKAWQSGGEKTFGEILKTVETVGTASTMGYLNAKLAKPGRPAIEVGGVPVDLALGILGTVVSLSDYLGAHSEHAHNFANGFLCSYSVRMGMMWGAEARVARNVQATINARAAGMLPPPPPPNMNGQQFMQQQPQFDWAA